MEEILRTRIRALEEENERLTEENNRLRNNAGAGFRASLENSIPLPNLQPQAQDPPPRAQGLQPDAQGLQPDAQDIQRQSTLKFRAYGFGLERLEWISRARVDQTE